MYLTFLQLSDLQREQLQAFNAVGQSLCGTAEKLASLNLEAARALFEDASEATRSLLGTKNAQEVLAIVRSMAQPAEEKLENYSRNALGIASLARKELASIIETHFENCQSAIDESLETAAEGAPFGSQAAVSMLKNAIGASRTAYETVSKAAYQTVELAETNYVPYAGPARDLVPPKARKTNKAAASHSL